MSKMSSQQLLLSWKEHNGAVVSVFENLLKRNTLVDCTLAADGQYLKAHKVVLSACSSYFELLFSQESEKNPIVILKDVEYQDLEAAVNFMYRGEVEVFEDRLGAFMEVAESLQIKGLGRCGKRNVENILPENKLKTSSILRERLKKDDNNTSGDNPNESSNHPVLIDKNTNSEILSIHQASKCENPCPPYSVCTPCFIPSTSSPFQQLPQSDQSSLVKCSSPIVPNMPSSESAYFKVNEVIKTEPIAEVCIEDKCDEEFVDNVTIKEDMEEWSEQNTNSINDEHLSNTADLGYPSVEMSEESNNMTVVQEGEHSTSEGGAVSEDRTSVTCRRRRILQRILACGVCRKVFVSPSSLERHVRTHTGERPFRCDLCGKAFTRMHILQQHRRIHTGEKPYRCDQCGKSFTQSSHLQTHRAIHSDERPYRCSVCGMTTAYKSYLEVHKRKVHGAAI